MIPAPSERYGADLIWEITDVATLWWHRNSRSWVLHLHATSPGGTLAIGINLGAQAPAMLLGCVHALRQR
jgi:hypothetical protein